MLRKCKDMTFNLKSSVVTSNISSDFISEQYFQLNLNIFLIKVTTPNLSPAANEKTEKKYPPSAGWAADPVFLGCFTAIRTGSAGSSLRYGVEPSRKPVKLYHILKDKKRISLLLFLF